MAACWGSILTVLMRSNEGSDPGGEPRMLAYETLPQPQLRHTYSGCTPHLEPNIQCVYRDSCMNAFTQAGNNASRSNVDCWLAFTADRNKSRWLTWWSGEDAAGAAFDSPTASWDLKEPRPSVQLLHIIFSVDFSRFIKFRKCKCGLQYLN